MSKRERRLVFGEVADVYERVRPGYPSELIDDVVSLACVSAGDRVLEVGAGTGKATRLFAVHGLRMVCLEPSPAMVAIARRCCAPFPDVSFEVTSFEDWPVGPGAFRLLLSAQAWHWVSPAVRCSKAHEALVPGGVVALFWNGSKVADAELRMALDDVYARHASALTAPAPGTMKPVRDGADLSELERSGLFVAVAERRYAWCEDYTTARYLDLMQTHSDHRILDEDGRRRLLDAVAEVIVRAGAVITIDYVTTLYVARRL